MGCKARGVACRTSSLASFVLGANFLVADSYIFRF
jgi:hypothetical protein